MLNNEIICGMNSFLASYFLKKISSLSSDGIYFFLSICKHGKLSLDTARKNNLHTLSSSLLFLHACRLFGFLLL